MDFLQLAIALIVTLGILVTIHEYGHFWVARRCGVKVLRFSIGFGSPLYRWYDKQGTEFVIAALPLGGYVKMLDEREGDVPDEQKHMAFNRKGVWQRIAIASAGPAANFLFAILAYWCMFLVGTQTVRPIIGDVTPQSAAWEAGLDSGMEIVAVDGTETPGWSEVNFQLMHRLGDTGSIELTVVPSGIPLDRMVSGGDDLMQEAGRFQGSGQAAQLSIRIRDWLQGEVEPNPLASLGIRPYRPPLPPILGQVLADGPGAAAGLQSEDQVLRVEGVEVSQWQELVDIVKVSAGTPLALDVLRGEQTLQLTVTPGAREEAPDQGYIGVAVDVPEYPQALLTNVNYGPLQSLGAAFVQTGDMVVMILVAIKKMLTGLIAVENLGGPITIAKVAGASVETGLESFLNFLAYLSISLGVLNLLPIPVLDGGHLLYYFIEVVRGKPLSEETQLLGLKIGMAVIAFIMLFAFYNDLARL